MKANDAKDLLHFVLHGVSVRRRTPHSPRASLFIKERALDAKSYELNRLIPECTPHRKALPVHGELRVSRPRPYQYFAETAFKACWLLLQRQRWGDRKLGERTARKALNREVLHSKKKVQRKAILHIVLESFLAYQDLCHREERNPIYSPRAP